jgi:hypothetical protein
VRQQRDGLARRQRETRGTDIDDLTFFETTLARIVAEDDGTRYYQPTSPYSPDGLEPNVDHAGNQHPWSIGFANTDIHGYRQMHSRFAVEGGTLGATALPTIRACLPPGHEFPWSFAFQQHDNTCPADRESVVAGQNGPRLDRQGRAASYRWRNTATGPG